MAIEIKEIISHLGLILSTPSFCLSLFLFSAIELRSSCLPGGKHPCSAGRGSGASPVVSGKEYACQSTGSSKNIPVS